MGGKVIVDTNIIVSALGWGGRPLDVFRIIRDGAWRIVLSDAQAEEIERVLSYPRLGLTALQRDAVESLLSDITERIHVTRTLEIVHDRGDNDLIEAASLAHAAYLITGDHELLKLKMFESTMILSPSEFVERHL